MVHPGMLGRLYTHHGTPWVYLPVYDPPLYTLGIPPCIYITIVHPGYTSLCVYTPLLYTLGIPPCVTLITTIGWCMDGTPLCATYPHHRGYMGGRPFVYPIFPVILPGETEGSCADLPLFFHTFGRRKGSIRLLITIILRVEPRALTRTPRRTARTGHQYGHDVGIG